MIYLQTRKRILSLTQKDAERLSVGKSTLHYLRKHARDDRRFTVNRKMREKIKIENELLNVDKLGANVVQLHYKVRR